MWTVPVSPENPYRVLTILGTVPASPQKHTTTKPHVSVAIVARVAESASLPQPSQSSLALAMPAVHSRMKVRRRFTHKQAAPGSGPSSRRRLQGKQPPPDRSSMLRAAVQAQAHGLECADDTLQPLGPKVRRNHVHYTHVRTRNPTSTSTRATAWLIQTPTL